MYRTICGIVSWRKFSLAEGIVRQSYDFWYDFINSDRTWEMMLAYVTLAKLIFVLKYVLKWLFNGIIIIRELNGQN